MGYIAPIIIKIKHGEELRSFTTYASKDSIVDMDLNALRIKIQSLFQISPDTNFELSYIDDRYEDECYDEIPLIEDNDLCEAIIIGLNPLLIIVESNQALKCPTCGFAKPEISSNSYDQGHLCSSLICHVNVEDGTVLDSNAKVIKKWKLLNDGDKPWPSNSRLVWIGGDMLPSENSIHVEIPAEGLAVNEEVDISVNFEAPMKPGNYISLWKMQSDSGKIFGQTISVRVQVGNKAEMLKEKFSDLKNDFTNAFAKLGASKGWLKSLDNNVKDLFTYVKAGVLVNLS